MKKTKKAIGYVCDIPVAGTDAVIKKEDQLVRLMKYAEKENLELVCICEDDNYTEDFMNRPGVKKVLNGDQRFDVLLVERVWCLSRKRKELDPFLAELDKKDVQITASSYLWDCLSQQIRHRYTGKMCDMMKAEALAQVSEKSKQNAA